MSQGVPCIAITYGGNKGTGIMADMGLNKYSVPIADVSGEILVTKFKELIDEKEAVKEKINRKLLETEHERVEIIERLRR